MYTSDTKETPNPNNANVESNTSTLQLSSTYNNGVQGPESSNSLGPPPYTKNAPLDDPFRGGDAHVGYFYPKSKGVQKDFRPATATRVDLPSATTTPLEPLPPVPTDDADSFAVDVVLDGSLLPPQPLPARPSGLKRGLQIPSRVSLITWGFSFPPVLAEQGVTKSQWKLFKHELKAFARLSLGQWVTVIACTQGVSLLFGQIIGHVVGHKMMKQKQHENFHLAYEGGAMKVLEDRWNKDYFHPLGLHVRIEPPGIGKMDGMDVASSKLFKYQQKMGTSSPAPGVASKQGDKKEYKYQSKEGRYRMKAVRKGRIIVLPYNTGNSMPSQSRTTGSESQNLQTEGVITRARPSVQDFAGLNQRAPGSEGLDRTPTTAQRLASSHQIHSSSEGLYRGRSEDVERAPSPARAATTHWGGNR